MALLKNIIICIKIWIDYFVDYLFGLYYEPKRKFISKPKRSLVMESAISLANKIKEKQVTCEEVVKAFVEHIQEVNPILNAVVDERFDEAINEAKEIDRNIKDGKINDDTFKQKPFLGVPFTTKESTSCKKLKNTFGLVCRKTAVATEDADVVKSLKEAGGILLGVTNVPILCMSQDTTNTVYGTTNNPYNSTRTVGGSSGGEAAIIAACGSPMGIGSDIGGSLRIPAFMCGIFAHKPTPNLIPTKGLTYRTGNEGPSMVTAGPMTRYSEDIIPFLKVLLGKNVDKITLDQPVNLKEIQIHYAFETGDLRLSVLGREMKQVVRKAINYFDGKTLSPPLQLKEPNIKYGGKIWRYWLNQEKSNFKKDLTDRKGEVSPCVEIIKFLTRQTEFDLGTIMMLINEMLPAVDEKWAKDVTDKLKTSLLQKLGKNGVILYPSAPWSARHHNTTLFRPYNFYRFALWNALGLPVIQVPLGLDKDNLPVGIQVVAATYQDHLCIAVAKELEKAFGGYVPPFDLKQD